jgi:hypothetical protein
MTLKKIKKGKRRIKLKITHTKINSENGTANITINNYSIILIYELHNETT